MCDMRRYQDSVFGYSFGCIMYSRFIGENVGWTGSFRKNRVLIPIFIKRKIVCLGMRGKYFFIFLKK